MTAKITIELADVSWNPVRGCTRASTGCDHCYAERVAARFSGRAKREVNGPLLPLPYHGLAKMVHGKPHWTGKIALIEKDLEAPLHWRKPCRVFVNSMSDLAHEGVPLPFFVRMMNTMASATLTCRHRFNAEHDDECWSGEPHTFLALTKRPKRLRELILAVPNYASDFMPNNCALNVALDVGSWPPPNLHLGVSVENQAAADERIPDLLETPAAVRFLSLEPLLGAVDSRNIGGRDRDVHDALTGEWENDNDETGSSTSTGKTAKLDWVIVGGESGPGARPMHPDWARSVRDQCVAAGVPFFFKQWGEWGNGSDGHVRPEREHVVLNDGKHFPFGEIDNPGTWNARNPQVMTRVGKKRAGRLLDGRTWDQMPGVKG